MKRLLDTRKILQNNRGETIVEVLVAFTLLSIMLVLFSQGIAWASRSETRATQSRDSADRAMEALQSQLASEPRFVSSGDISFDNGGKVKRMVYMVDGYAYVVYKPVAESGG